MSAIPEIFKVKTDLPGIGRNKHYKISWKAAVTERWTRRQSAKYLGKCNFQIEINGKWGLLIATPEEIKVFHQVTGEQLYPK